MKKKKYIPRIYYSKNIKKKTKIKLKNKDVFRVNKILHMKTGEKVELFNGKNITFIGRILEINKKKILIQIEQSKKENKESNLFIHLGQILPKKKTMEFIIQKSVEIGVNIITPIYSKYSNTKINLDKTKKIQKRWKKIIISSCEQCGRNIIPFIRPIMSFKEWCSEKDQSLKIIFQPHINSKKTILPKYVKNVRLLIGPETGFSFQEKLLTKKNNFIEVSLCPRILRSETAALSAITTLQVYFGDFSIGKKNV